MANVGPYMGGDSLYANLGDLPAAGCALFSFLAWLVARWRHVPALPDSPSAAQPEA